MRPGFIRYAAAAGSIIVSWKTGGSRKRYAV